MGNTPDLVPDWLKRRSVTHQDTPALVTPTKQLTYKQLYQEAVNAAGELTALGVSGYVGLLVKDGSDFAVTMHALIQAGLIVVPLNWRLTAAELAWQVRDAKMEWLIHDDLGAAQAEQIASDVAGLHLFNTSNRGAKDVSPIAVNHIALDHVHAIIYTSGTTGHPKGTEITYGNEWWSATGSAYQLGVLPTDRWLVPLPLFHMGGLSVLLRSVMYGTTAVVHNGFDVETVNEAIDNGDVTLASLVPTMLQRMLTARNGRPYPSSLRAVLLGGSAASLSLLQTAHDYGVQVAQSYGMTETASQVCTLPPRDFKRKLGSSGLPAVMNEIVIVDEHLEDRDCDPLQFRRPAEVPGEIIIRGPTVTPGYLGNPEATSKAIRDGWLWTGDIGYIDAEGYLYVLDRRRDLIVSGGENIYPAEVESALESHKAIIEAAVVGVSDEEWGQVPIAVLVLSKDASSPTEEELTTFCGKVLARYKIPRRYLFVEELPRNASGKLLRRNLQEWLKNKNRVQQR